MSLFASDVVRTTEIIKSPVFTLTYMAEIVRTTEIVKSPVFTLTYMAEIVRTTEIVKSPVFTLTYMAEIILAIERVMSGRDKMYSCHKSHSHSLLKTHSTVGMLEKFGENEVE